LSTIRGGEYVARIYIGVLLPLGSNEGDFYEL